MTHQPKGGMCAVCAKRFDNCSSLDFKSMRVIAHDNDTKIVACTKFKMVEK